MRWILLAAAAIVAYQVLCPPIIGLADQGDFRRVIGKFGYGPEQTPAWYAYMSSTYVRDSNNRLPDWEQSSSEDLFVSAAIITNKVVSKDGKLDIRIVGVVHALAFLSAFAWLLHQTRSFRARYLIWIMFLVITTDVARVMYFNTFYAEPASYVFCILLLAESIGLVVRGIYTAKLVRWFVWGVLFVLAKPMNAPLGLLVAAFAIIHGWRSKLVWAGAAAILSAAAFMFATSPSPMRDVNTYDLVFLAVLPESKDPAADAVTLGIDPALIKLSGIGAWGKGSVYPELRSRGIIGKKVTIFSVFGFYLARPARIWRRVRHEIQVAILLRPPLGNFDPSSGLTPGSVSKAFALWTDFHEQVLARVARLLFLLLPVPAVVAFIRRISTRRSNFAEDCFALLGLCCMTSFLAVTFSSPWETVKHMLIFNVLLDASLICAGAFAWSAATNVYQVIISQNLAAAQLGFKKN